MVRGDRSECSTVSWTNGPVVPQTTPASDTRASPRHARERAARPVLTRAVSTSAAPAFARGVVSTSSTDGASPGRGLDKLDRRRQARPTKTSSTDGDRLDRRRPARPTIRLDHENFWRGLSYRL